MWTMGDPTANVFEEAINKELDSLEDLEEGTVMVRHINVTNIHNGYSLIDNIYY